MIENIKEFIKNVDTNALKIFFIVFISFLGIMIAWSMLSIIKSKVKERELKDKILFPEKYAYVLNSKEGKEKLKKKKKFFLKRFYDEYVFFYKNGKPLFFVAVIGYFLTALVLYLLSNSVAISFILAFSFIILEYIFIDNKTAKARKKYIKGFASAISVLSTSTEAGNTLEKGINSVVNRDTINTRIRYEFSLINNDLKRNISLEEALEHFYKRNSGFQEISMFVVVVQFFSKKGGDGLRLIFQELSQNLNNKINNYAEIDSEIGIYKVLMNIFIYGYFGVLLVINIFMPTFYPDLIDQGVTGILKVIFSVFLYGFGIWFYKTMLRNSAEG